MVTPLILVIYCFGVFVSSFTLEVGAAKLLLAFAKTGSGRTTASIIAVILVVGLLVVVSQSAYFKLRERVIDLDLLCLALGSCAAVLYLSRLLFLNS